MSKNKEIAGNEVVQVMVVPDEVFKDPKTGKTINRKNSMIIVGGAALAGAALNDQLQNQDLSEIFPDSDGDSLADTVLTDTNDDGVYEAAMGTNADNPLKEQKIQDWNPKEAPLASEGTVNDAMSFSQAFASAREELGAGGVFHWKGEYYNTFYAEELDGNNQPVVEYQTTDHHELPVIEYTGEIAGNQDAEAVSGQETNSMAAETEPGVLAADLNADGVVDAVFIDLNQDGSADAMYTDPNQDGQLTEDELVLIHDPESLSTPEVPADGSVISVDANADGTDEILLEDVNADQIADVIGIDENNNQQIEQSEVTILNENAMDNEAIAPAGIEYSGEISTDVPEDVSEDVLESLDNDLATLEDNFEEINDWS